MLERSPGVFECGVRFEQDSRPPLFPLLAHGWRRCGAKVSSNTIGSDVLSDLVAHGRERISKRVGAPEPSGSEAGKIRAESHGFVRRLEDDRALQPEPPNPEPNFQSDVVARCGCCRPSASDRIVRLSD